MKDKIKVHLQYPWKFPDSPYYKYLINSPPKNIKYQNIKIQKGVITNKRFFWFSNFLKRNIRKSTRILFPSLPNAHLSQKKDYHLIHCAHCLSKNKDVPWVADVEYSSQLWIAGSTPKDKTKVIKILLRKNCKKIISWTKLMEKELLNKFPEIKNKLITIYPGVPVLSTNKKHQDINLLFSARYFFQKGGYHALEVIDRLTKKYQNVNGFIISPNIPKGIKKKYEKNKKIRIFDIMPQEKLIKHFYSITDIFIYPGYGDSFGFSIPEVMGIGIPIVSVDTKSRKEIITNGKTGYIIENSFTQPELIKLSYTINDERSKKLINLIEKKTLKLIENVSLRKKMAKNSKIEIKEGKFSIKKQRKLIEKIYIEAIE